MDYKITQAQLNNIISKYLEIKDYKVVEDNNEVHLVDSSGDFIITLTFGGDCVISAKLINNLKKMLGIKSYVVIRNSISDWVEKKFQIPIQYIYVM
jgi:diacylglycerol kinase family enzyme